MRLNRGTIALIVVALVVIIGVAVLNNKQATAPGATTPTPETVNTALWQGLDQNNVTRLEVRDNHTGQAIVLGKAQNGGWDVVNSGISESASTGGVSSVTYTKPQSFPIDTAKVTASVNAFAGLTAADKFDAESPADFGMDKPLYTIYATTSTGAIYAMHVGNKNPNSTRYYVTVQQIGGASTTPEATSATAGGEATDAAMAAIAAVNSAMDAQTNAISALDATPEATALVGANPTLNALANTIAESTSDAAVTEAAQALSAAVSATNAAVGAQASTAEATADATSGVAVATSEVRVGSENGPGSTVIAPTAVGSEEATAVMTAEATAAATAEAPEGTPVVLAEPLVVLTGKQTIYLVPQDIISGMIGFLALPPYVYPTATPTLPPTANPYSEVQQTATAVIQSTQMMGTMQSIISTATARAMTPEATAASTSAAPAEVSTAEATP